MSRVHYDVPGIQQGSNNTCWLACLQMLVRFRISVGRSVNDFARALLDPEFQSRLEDRDLALRPDRFEELARHFGLSAIHRPGLTRELRAGELFDPSGPYDVLSQRGPFTLGIILPAGFGHAVVLCGADTDDFTIEVIDPRYGDIRRVNYMRFRRSYRPDGGPLFVF